MGLIADTRKLYKEKINSITETEENWLDFLDCCSWHFKYDFVDKVLIYAQRPDATACAEMESEWNKKCHRWVNRNAKGIFVISKDEDNPYPFRLVFDRSDTHNSRGTDYKLWEVKPEYEEKIIETLETTFGAENKNNGFSNCIVESSYNMVTDNIQDYLTTIHANKKGTVLENLSEEEIKNIATLTVWASVSYMMMTRCGINAREQISLQEFALIKDFDNDKIITALGTAISDIAEMGLREIAKTVVNLEKNEKNLNHTFVENKKQEYSNNKEIDEGGIKDGEDRIQRNEWLSNTKFSNGERADTKRKIRKNEITLYKGTQKSRLFNIIDGPKLERILNRNSRNSNKNDKRDSDEFSREEWDNRGIENERPDDLDRSNEQLQGGSRGTSAERTNIYLENYNSNIWKDTNDKPKFDDYVTLDKILSNAPDIIKNKDLLKEYLKFNTDEDKQKYIKKILGNAYTEYVVDDNQRVGYKSYDNGLYLWKGDYLNRTEECFKSWEEITAYFVSNSLFNETLFEELQTEDEQKESVTEAENASVFNFTQEMIDSVLKEGSHFEEGKFRIYEFLSRGLSSKENADFLKQEYGIGGRSADSNGVSEDYDAKGIKLYVGFEDNRPEILLKWNQVEKRIRELISANRYLNLKEKDEYNDWLDVNGIKTPKSEIEKSIESEDYDLVKRLHSYLKEYDIVSYHNNFPLENTEEENIELLNADINDESNIREYIEFLKNSYEDLDYDDEISVRARGLIVELEKRLPFYEFHNGDIVYMGTDEFEITAIANDKVSLADTAFPLFTQELSREDFDKKVKENPANDKLRTGKRIDNLLEGKTEKLNDEVIENNSSVIENDNIQIEEKEVIAENSYKVGDIVYLENDRKFKIDKIDQEQGTISLQDLTLPMPIFREENIVHFEFLYSQNKKNQEIIEQPKTEEKALKANIKRKRKNKIEYFDLHPEIPLAERNNFKIQDNGLGVGGKKEKYRNNIEAIKILKLCESENRYATPEEQEILSKYVGWGGIQEAFDNRIDNWHTEYEELKGLLTEKEYTEARASTRTAFFTPPIVIKSIYKALENMGLQRGNILEPSCRCR